MWSCSHKCHENVYFGIRLWEVYQVSETELINYVAVGIHGDDYAY